MDNVATPEEILEFCNQVRAAGNAALLEELQPGHDGSTQSCLLAVNLNFDCEVNGDSGTDQWYMYSNNTDVLVRIARALDLEMDYSTKLGYPFCMKLPERIGNAARAFDAGELPDELYVR